MTKNTWEVIVTVILLPMVGQIKRRDTTISTTKRIIFIGTILALSFGAAYTALAETV